MTAHELARKLLEMPDVLVVVYSEGSVKYTIADLWSGPEYVVMARERL
jgi:hypothetical protein